MVLEVAGSIPVTHPILTAAVADVSLRVEIITPDETVQAGTQEGRILMVTGRYSTRVMSAGSVRSSEGQPAPPAVDGRTTTLSSDQSTGIEKESAGPMERARMTPLLSAKNDRSAVTPGTAGVS